MNSVIHSLNNLGATFSHFALALLVQSSLLIVALFLLDLALRKKARAVVRYPLWLLVLFKLVLPPSFAAPTSLAYWFPERKIAKPSMVTASPVVVHYSEAGFVEPPVIQTRHPPRPRLQVPAMLLLAWLVIALGLVMGLVRRSHSVAQAAARATPASKSPEEWIETCRLQMGIRQRIAVKLSANAGSPAVYGLWRPVILIPQALADKLTPLQMRAVLFHELAHINRGDVWVNYAQTLLQILYWWHPLLWLANAHIRRLREQAVDERVLVEMGGEADAYPATLLEVAKLATRRPMPALGLIGIVESKSALAQRIRHLLDRPAPTSAKLGFARLTAVALVGAALLPMARGQRPATQPQPGVNTPPAIVGIEVKFVELTDSALEAVSLGSPTVTGPNGHRAWVLPPDDDSIERMQAQPDTSILYTPSVTTHSGQEAQVRITQAQDFNGTVIEVGPICDLLPKVSGDWIDLSVSATVTEFGEIVSDQLNGLQLRPKQPDSSGKSEERAVSSVNATGYIIHDTGSARVSVGDAGCVVLQNPEVKSINGNRILVVVSPRIVRQTVSANTPAPNSVAISGPSSSTARPREETRVPPTLMAKSAQARPAGAVPKDDTNQGVKETLTVTITKTAPYFYLGSKPVSIQELKAELEREAARKTARAIFLRADHDARLGDIAKVAEVARAAGFPTDLITTSAQKNAPSVPQTNPSQRSGKPRPSDVAPSNSVPVLGDLPFLGQFFRSQSALASPGRKAIQSKLNRIVLPEIRFDNVRLLEAIQWLAKESTDRDPDGTGLNFLLNPNEIGAAQETMIDPSTGQLFSPPSTQPLDMNTVTVRINPPLKNVRLSDALEAIVKVADKRIRYSIEDYAVIFSPNPTGTAHLETRVFNVRPATLSDGLKKYSRVPPDSETIGSIQNTIRDFFTDAGVNVQPPNALFYNDRTGVLMVRATSTELDIVQKAIEMLNDRPPQLTIEARFMEMPTEVVRELGLDVPPPDGASNTWTRVLTAAQARAILHAAKQRAGVTILSVPKITTLSGRQAQIQAVEIKTFVNGIAPEALAPPGVRSTKNNPAQPYLTSQVPCGPTMDVVATVDGDGYRIHLTALPQVTELTQFRPYSSAQNGAKEMSLWMDGRQQKVPMPPPVIRTRQMQASVDLYDGQTLVLGSPSVTMVLKQPTGESVTNAVRENPWKRLLVFITPTIIDPAGNPIHPSGHETWADKIPPQPR